MKKALSIGWRREGVGKTPSPSPIGPKIEFSVRLFVLRFLLIFAVGGVILPNARSEQKADPTITTLRILIAGFDRQEARGQTTPAPSGALLARVDFLEDPPRRAVLELVAQYSHGHAIDEDR